MHEIMTIEDVADYLRVSEQTVYDWAQKGELPGGKLGDDWRFKRDDIERWLSRRLGAHRPVSRATVDPGTLGNILTADRVVFIESNKKSEALEQLSAILATSPLVNSRNELQNAIFLREELMSTGIGFGVGVPHVRIDSVDDLVMALGIARAPIADYASLDDVPVQIVCMVAAGSKQHPEYIRALSAISSKLKEEAGRTALIAAKDEQTAFTIFTG